jgi:hypothetical protein
LFHRALSFILAAAMAASSVAQAAPAPPAEGPDLGSVANPSSQPSKSTSAKRPQLQRDANPNRLGVSSGTCTMGGRACNCWVLDDNTIATNNHCVQGLNSPKVMATFNIGTGGETAISNCTNVFSRTPKLDYALVKCTGVGRRIPPIVISNQQVPPNEKLTLVTHDFGAGGAKRRIASGTLKGYRPGEFGLKEVAVAKGAFSQKGNSGSLFFDERGNAIGLLWGGPTAKGDVAFYTSLDLIVKDIRDKKLDIKMKFDTDASVERIVAFNKQAAEEAASAAKIATANAVPESANIPENSAAKLPQAELPTQIAASAPSMVGTQNGDRVATTASSAIRDSGTSSKPNIAPLPPESEPITQPVTDITTPRTQVPTVSESVPRAPVGSAVATIAASAPRAPTDTIASAVSTGDISPEPPNTVANNITPDSNREPSSDEADRPSRSPRRPSYRPSPDEDTSSTACNDSSLGGFGKYLLPVGIGALAGYMAYKFFNRTPPQQPGIITNGSAATLGPKNASTGTAVGITGVFGPGSISNLGSPSPNTFGNTLGNSAYFGNSSGFGSDPSRGLTGARAPSGYKSSAPQALPLLKGVSPMPVVSGKARTGLRTAAPNGGARARGASAGRR